MGEMMTLAVTGAGGFLGRAVVAAALARGHAVRALVRRADSAPKGAAVFALDLADPVCARDLRVALNGVDAVIHVAARMEGDDASHAHDTLAATEAVYSALRAQGPVVLAGSMAVYEGREGRIDETSPLEPVPEARDAYARAKLAQERIAADYAGRGVNTRILRLGAIWAKGRMWNAHIGSRAGPVGVVMAGQGELPLLALGDAALALVLAAEVEEDHGIEVLNIVGDDRPDARAWLGRMGQAERPPILLPLPWRVALPLAELARLLRLPVPGLLRPRILRYRMTPRSYDNARAKAVLGWQPEDTP